MSTNKLKKYCDVRHASLHSTFFSIQFNFYYLRAADKISHPQTIGTGWCVEITVVFSVFHETATTPKITIDTGWILIVVDGVPEILVFFAFNNLF